MYKIYYEDEYAELYETDDENGYEYDEALEIVEAYNREKNSE